MADDKKREPRKSSTPLKTQIQKDKAVAKDPDIRGVNRQEARRG